MAREAAVLGHSNRVDLVDRVRAPFSVSNFLMPASYDDVAKAYTLCDLSVGTFLELTPLPASVLSDGELEGYSDAIALALSRLPEHAIVQTMVVPWRNVDGDIDAYLAQGGDEHPVIATHERMVAEQYRSSVSKPLFAFQFGEGGFKTKRYRVLISIVIRPDDMVGGGKASLFDFITSLVRRRSGAAVRRTPAEERYLTMRERLYKRLQEASRRLEGTLRTNHIAVRRLEPTDLVACTQMLLYPESTLGRKPSYDPTQQLCAQIALGDLAVEPATGAVLTDGMVYKTLTMSAIPRSTTPGATTLPQASLGWFSLLDFIGDGFLTVSAHCKPVKDVRQFIDKRKTFVRGGFAMPAKVPQLLKDLELTSYWIETERRKMFDTQLTICVRGATELEAQERAEKVRDKAADVGIDCRVEQHYAPSAFFQSLPFGFAPTVPEARRLWMMPDRGVADLMPLFMQSRGTRRPQLLLHNRAGEPFALNPFDSPTAAHCVICGESGSGKSFFTNYLIFSALRRPETQVFAIDKGRSYATATAMLGEKGSYNNMGLASKTCINAFAGTLNDASAFLRQFIAHLASQVASDRLTSDQMGVVDECITRSFARKQKTFAWRTFEEIHKRWPRGAWVDRMRKRMAVRPLDAMQRSTVEQLKAKDSGRAPEFELYTRAVLDGRTLIDRDSGRTLREERYIDSKSIDQDSKSWLESRGFLVEDFRLADGETVASVLYLNPTQERSLEMDGFAWRALPGELVLEVARREDLHELAEAGVQVVYPSAFIAERRAALAAEVRLEHPGAGADVIADIVAQRLADISPVEYFDAIDGVVRMQFEVFFADLIRELKEHPAEAMCAPIVSRLAAYHGTGPLAGFFDGETQFRLAGPKLITFELQELSSAGEHLVAAVVGTLLQMLVLYCQGEHLPGGGPRSYPKYIVLDEFWALLAVPMVADLVINGLRTLRKHNTAIVCISQLVRDFAGTERGKVVLSASQHRILLRQPPDVIAEFDQQLNWSDEQKNLMYTVVSAKGMFSEAMVEIANQGICEVARFVPTPYAYWIFTTAPEDVKQRDLMRNQFRAEGQSAEDALDLALRECAQRWPNGFAAGTQRKAS